MPQDWFAQFRTPTPVTPPTDDDDFFSTYAVKTPVPAPPQATVGTREYGGKAFTTEEFLPAAKGWGDTLSRFATSLKEGVDPTPILKMVYHAGTASRDSKPLEEDLKNLWGAQSGLFKKFKAATAEGRYSEAAGYLVTSAIPLAGPMIANVGEQVGEGNFAGAAGSVLAVPLGNKIAKALPTKIKPGLGKNVNAATADAIQYGLREGIPIDLPTATGTPILRGTQAIAENSTITGGIVGAKANLAREAAFDRVGSELAARANPIGGTVSAEQAGDAVRRAVQQRADLDAVGRETAGGQIAADVYPRRVNPEQAGRAQLDEVGAAVTREHEAATAKYDVVRAAEADPRNIRRVPDPNRPVRAQGRISARDQAGTMVDDVDSFNPDSFDAPAPPAARARQFAPPDASFDDVFEGAFADAQRNGYKGGKGALKVKFRDEWDRADGLRKDMAEAEGDFGDAALLQAIRDVGGIKPYEVVPGSNKRWKVEEHDSLRQAFEKNWGHRGASSLYRNDGLGIDVALQDIQAAHPQYRGLDTESLRAKLEDIASRGPSKPASGDMEHYLSAGGVQTGAKWWETAEPLLYDEATGQMLPPSDGMVDMPLPVDLRGSKAALAPIYARMLKQMPGTQQAASKGLLAIKNIVEGPDFAPLTQVDIDLGQIKSIARGADPMFRDLSQGLAGTAVEQLDRAVLRTAGEAGPDVVAALKEGRGATKRKYDNQDVLDSMGTATLGPEPVQVFNRTLWADDSNIVQQRAIAARAPKAMPMAGRAFVDQLTELEGVAAKKKWDATGLETKRLMYTPEQLASLDKFFEPVPGGSAAEVLKTLHAEPVVAIRKLVAAKDAGIVQLRAIKKVAPDEIPVIARALIEDTLDQARTQGGFDKADKLKADWDRIGDATKAELYEPAHLADLDKFFLLLKKSARDANPTGSGKVAAVAGRMGAFKNVATGAAGAAGGMAMLNPAALVPALVGWGAWEMSMGSAAAVLRSPKLTKMLVRNTEIPIGSAATKAAAARFNMALSEAGIPHPPIGATAEERQPAPAPAIVQR